MQSALRSEWVQGLLHKHWGKLLIVQAVILFGFGYLLASGGSDGQERAEEVGASTQAASGPTMWTCSMHPQIRQPNPGDCPICGMDLIPVAKTSGGMRTLTVSPESKALMNIQTSPVERRYVTHEIPMVGKVAYDETKLGYITAWVAGRLDRLYVDFTGVEVKKGYHMVYIYSEELYSAQEELIQSIKYSTERRPSDAIRTRSQIDLAESAREKLRNWGLTEEQIKEIEQRGTPSYHVTIYAKQSGIVIEKLKQEGERVRLGDRIYTIADLSQVWVHLDAYESDLTWIRYGQEVTITTEAYPGELFKGRVAFIQPVLNDKTRTVKVRVNVPNADGKLKPDMFVRAAVRPMVAAGGRVLDPSLVGKWISPMHPEIIKDEPGTCDVCGMPLVRADTLGIVAAETDPQAKPLVIPYSAALVTGTRAVVYVELPAIHSRLEPSFQAVSAAIESGDVGEIRGAFAAFGSLLDSPYDHPGTVYAKQLWSQYADRLSEPALAGQRVRSAKEAEQVFVKLESLAEELREVFAPIGQPTFEGHEIVLGPRAGNFYQVRHGLEEGELVVTQGNFKIDAEIQIQAKPSMMTPEGGGGGGHDHGGGGAKKAAGDEHAEHQMSLPAEFQGQIRDLDAAYDEVAKAINEANVATVQATFADFRRALATVDGSALTGHPRMLWKELSMLLENDAVEGGDATVVEEADRVYLTLKGHMRRMREQFGVSHEQERAVEHIAVGPEFQSQLARLWRAYVPMQAALAGDDFDQATRGLSSFISALGTLDDGSLSGHAQHVWKKEQANLTKIVDSLQAAKDIKTMRTEFLPLSQEVGVLAKTFGFGDTATVFELHCPMAFQGRGGVWFQDNDQPRNPYYGSTMLKCADRVEPVMAPGKDEPQQGGNKGHQHNH